MGSPRRAAGRRAARHGGSGRSDAASSAASGSTAGGGGGSAPGRIPQGVVDTLAGIEDLVKTVGFRNPGARLSCTVGIGATAWRAMRGDDPGAAPAELHPFKEFVGEVHAARATPGDLLFHIRADRQDLAYEFERLLLGALGTDVRVEDEVSGFRYFDGRDLLGFVDGTANPVGPDLPVSALIGDEDPGFAGGSYVVVQKYLHNLDAWGGLTVEDQEAVIGRTKSDNVELPDAESGQRSHKTLATITDAEGVEHDIVRDNMPFATPGSGIHGTYFIGYSRRLTVIEQMLERMFIGDPPGKYDRILDFSTAATGSTYFVPTAAMLAGLGG
ncbi:Dyp-type peroxidase [Leucobacter sp. CSA2]|uniref:Dyp-type peroxidase n=2 Tax=Leucobacter edaphi TaxID=2796472 RepID=A0A934QBP7_9MICO|nr:Dyp-type peroxidase [Leucobacter edaphi]